MTTLIRYASLLRLQLKQSALLSLRYRVDFLLDGVLALFGTVTTIVPLFIVFAERPQLEGWSFGEALIVVGWFTLLQGVLEGCINPSLTQVVEQIRQGTLDFVLLKPVDAQFLVSTARILPWRATNILNALAIFIYAFTKIGHAPTLSQIALGVAMLLVAVTLLYSLWILTVSAAFYVVKMDNLIYLFDAIFDFARWPSNVFRGVVAFVFTFIIPLALMTTFPAEALLGRLHPQTFFYSLLGAIVFSAIARAVWLKSIGHYTSASS